MGLLAGGRCAGGRSPDRTPARGKLLERCRLTSRFHPVSGCPLKVSAVLPQRPAGCAGRYLNAREVLMAGLRVIRRRELIPTPQRGYGVLLGERAPKLLGGGALGGF